MKPTHLDLFSGIGGLSLAAHWAGFETVAHCEIEPYPRAVLKKHWPDVPVFEDVRNVTVESVRAVGIGHVDLLTGGFPCQDISAAGKGVGLTGARSGLWFEMLRVISEVKPTWVLAENVAALRTKGIDTVLAGLESAGYTPTSVVVGANAVGAPHQRNRVFIVAHARSGTEPAGAERAGRTPGANAHRGSAWAEMADAYGHHAPERGQRSQLAGGGDGWSNERGGSDSDPRQIAVRSAGQNPRSVADANGGTGRTSGAGEDQAGPTDAPCGSGLVALAPRELLNGDRGTRGGWPESSDYGSPVADANDTGRAQQRRRESGGEFLAPSEQPGRGQSESRLGRDADGVPPRLDCARWPSGPGEEQQAWEPPRLAKGVPNRVARLKACGNAVVPAQAYPILKAIREAL